MTIRIYSSSLTRHIQIIIQKLVQRGHEVTVMRSAAYTDFIKNDIPDVSMFDFYVPYAPGMHLASMDEVLFASKLGHNDDISSFRRVQHKLKCRLRH